MGADRRREVLLVEPRPVDAREAKKTRLFDAPRYLSNSGTVKISAVPTSRPKVRSGAKSRKGSPTTRYRPVSPHRHALLRRRGKASRVSRLRAPRVEKPCTRRILPSDAANKPCADADRFLHRQLAAPVVSVMGSRSPRLVGQ